MPMTHYHYEEYEPGPAKTTWEEFLDSANRKGEREEKPAGSIKTLEVIKRHQKPRLDGTDWVCDACGSVTADFDLFEEVGAEVNCKSVEESVAVEEVSQKEARITRKPPPTYTTHVKTEMSEEIMDMYKKMLNDIRKEERREFKLPSWPKVGEVYTGRNTRIVEESEEHFERKGYTELAKEYRAARENPENQKKWYSEVQREMQRRERRR